MVSQIYSTEQHLSNANSFDTEAQFLDLDLSLTNGIFMINKDNFYFEIVNFSLLGGDISRSPSYGVYVSQLIRFSRVCSNVGDLTNRSQISTPKILKQDYRYHTFVQLFLNFITDTKS